jgi:mono/diheme cytochrome c family protein
LDFIPMPEVQAAVQKIKSGGASEADIKTAYLQTRLYEGRTLYEFNCRPCHGDKTDGNGPMADGFRLRPIDFTDNGTLETIVEGYIFWRIRNGGPGLPPEATPWNSAMPIWKKDLTDEQIWMIMMAELDLAQKTARIPETMH